MGYIILFLLTLCSIISITYFNEWIKPLRLMFKGNFAESITLFKKTAAKYKNRLSTRDNAFYNIAAGYHRLGNFEESIEWLNKINKKKLNKNLSGVYYGLYAMNLIVLKRDLNLAEDYF